MNKNTKPLIMVTANSAWNIYSRKRLLTALQDHGYDVICMGAAGSISGTKNNPDQAANEPKKDPYVEKLMAETGISFIPLPMEGDGTKLLKDLKLFFTFWHRYGKYKPKTVLHFNNKPNIYGSIAATIHGIKSFSNITGLGVVAEKKGFTASIVYTLYRIAFASKKTFVFFQNSDDRRFFLDRNLISAQRTGLLPGSGVDTERFKPAEINVTNGQTVTGAATSTVQIAEPVQTGRNGALPVHFLFNGRLLITKGICDYITAARTVRKTYPKTVFSIIGEHDPANSIFIPEKQLQSAITDGTVVWHGLVEDVIPYVQKADCVVLPSYYREGVPRVLLEAAAMGKALIAADSIGTKEPVENGKNGYLTVPADADSLAEAMLKYIKLSTQQKQEMGAASRTIAIKRFSDNLIINAYLNRIAARQ